MNMKAIIMTFCIFIMITASLSAQMVLNNDGSPADGSAMLEVSSTTMGFLPPRMTSAQRNAISAPATGLMIYNTTIQCIEFYDGTGWVNLCNINNPGGETDMCGEEQVYDTVHAAGYVWHDRNLGASGVAQSSDDYLAYGALFQWGRLSDGHECINWTGGTSGTAVNGTTTSLSVTDDPGHDLFILNGSHPQDWRNPPNDNLWQGVAGINNPCPAGFRIPTRDELVALDASFPGGNAAGAFNSPLKLPVAGYRHSSDGTFVNPGSYGMVHSSTPGVIGVKRLFYYSTSSTVNDGYRAMGMSVRCIMDE